MQKIDVDRGVTIRQIVKFVAANKFEPDTAYGGAFVYMYKDEPGIYYDVHGHRLPDGVAEKAGFPTKQHAKQRAIREAQAEFRDKMAKELAVDDEELTVVAEAGEWQVLRLPLGRAKIVDKETGENVTPVPMLEADALMFLDQLTGAKAGTAEVLAKASKGKPQEK